MSRKMFTDQKMVSIIEPNVIDEKMLQAAMEEQCPQEEASHISKKGVQFRKALQLRLEHKNIQKICYLWEFTSLTKLQLSFNIIRKIEGLEGLINLTWLDLSFNRIEKIEGLESLVKLEDLSLYNNRITVIENMDTLRNLTFLSIGNNLLDTLDSVIYLTKFKNLRTLNFAGNPLCKGGNYKMVIAAYISDLVYLDYRLLDERTKAQALSKYQRHIEELRFNELEALKHMEAKQSREQQLQLSKDAFVEGLDRSDLFNSMFTANPEAGKVRRLPGLADLLTVFEKQLGELCVQIYELGVGEHKLRQAKVKEFSDGLQEMVAEVQQISAQKVAHFELHKAKKLVELRQLSGTGLETQLNQYSEGLTELYNSLYSLEMNLSIKLEEIIATFKENMSDMLGSFINQVKDLFTQCRDLETLYHEKIKDIAKATLERVTKNEDISDDVRQLFRDKSSILSDIATLHDTLQLKIYNREDELMTNAKTWMEVLVKAIQDDEVKRNRMRILEIRKYIKYLSGQPHVL